MAEIQLTCALCEGQFTYHWVGSGRRPTFCRSCSPNVRRRKNPLGGVVCDRCGQRTFPRGPSQGRAKTCKACRHKHVVCACEGCGSRCEETARGLCSDCMGKSKVILRLLYMRRKRALNLPPYLHGYGVMETAECKECTKVFAYRPNSQHRTRTFCSRECGKRDSDRNRTKQRRALTRGSTVQKVDVTLVFERDGWRCQLCGRKTPRDKRGSTMLDAPELDHIISLASGGDHSYANVQCTCRSCNMAKGAKSVGQLKLFPMGFDSAA